MFDAVGRNRTVAWFRREVFKQCGLTLFPHQAEWQLATEGWTLLTERPKPGDHFANILIPDPKFPDSPAHAHVEARKIEPRQGGVARIAFDLASFKAGKSYSAAAWMTGFAILPGAQIQIIGAEYATAEPEFTYLLEFLCSERGMNMKPIVMQNDAAHGRMKLKFPKGATFEVKSWERKEGLKGKKITAYVYAEAYQLPGLVAWTSVSQNLRELQGFAIFPTTPDSAWVAVGHDYGHGQDPEWHCTCNVDARQNPYSYSQKDRDRDDPEKNGIMTREKYAIAWCGRLGHYVGSVYDFQRGQRAINPIDHPFMFKPAQYAGIL